MIPSADVYKGIALVAQLYRFPTGVELRFVPDAPLENGFLSTALQFSIAPIHSPDLPAFFLNLLPEGARLQLLLSASRAKDDLLALLLQVGWDTIGDVSVLPHGEVPANRQKIESQKELGEVSFWDLFHEGISSDASIPGVQEKLSDAMIAFKVKTKSTPFSILKLNPKKFPLLVQNEAFFLRMAKGCGLDVNLANIVFDNSGEAGLLVRRFERRKVNGAVLKLHQEDACQLLNAPPGSKYKHSLQSIVKAISEVCTSPPAECYRVLKLYVFSYIIGNCDLHAKNVSLIWDETVRLTPGYDLLSTLPYDLDRTMASPLDGRSDNFRVRHFCNFGKRFGVPEKATRQMMEQLCQKAEPWIGKFGEIGFGSKETQKLQREVARRLEDLLK